MKIANISEAKAHFSGLIEKVIAGEGVIIGKAGKLVAKLVSYESNIKDRNILMRRRDKTFRFF